MNITGKQWVSIAIAVLGVMVASTSQLTDLFGPTATKTIVSASGLLMSVLSGIMISLTSQGATVQAVQDMPGIDKITVNRNANQTLATMAVDPAQRKIEASPGAEAAVQRTSQQ